MPILGVVETCTDKKNVLLMRSWVPDGDEEQDKLLCSIGCEVVAYENTVYAGWVGIILSIYSPPQMVDRPIVNRGPSVAGSQS